MPATSCPARDRALLAGLVAMAAALDMTTVAEGIENAEQADVLRELGVGLGQGWHYGRPVLAPDAVWAAV